MAQHIYTEAERFFMKMSFIFHTYQTRIFVTYSFLFYNKGKFYNVYFTFPLQLTYSETIKQ